VTHSNETHTHTHTHNPYTVTVTVTQSLRHPSVLPQDVRALARLLALSELKLPNVTGMVPNYLFGMASALAARRMSNSLGRKRPLSEALEAPNVKVGTKPAS